MLLASALALTMSQDYLRGAKLDIAEYPVLVLLATAGMMLMLSANDLISLYLSLELQSLRFTSSPRSDGIRCAPARRG